MTKQWTAYVIVYHKFAVEGDTWDDDVKEVEINLEENEHE